jgi:hypothetical protein
VRNDRDQTLYHSVLAFLGSRGSRRSLGLALTSVSSEESDTSSALCPRRRLRRKHSEELAGFVYRLLEPHGADPSPGGITERY